MSKNNNINTQQLCECKTSTTATICPVCKRLNPLMCDSGEVKKPSPSKQASDRILDTILRMTGHVPVDHMLDTIPYANGQPVAEVEAASAVSSSSAAVDKEPVRAVPTMEISSSSHRHRVRKSKAKGKMVAESSSSDDEEDDYMPLAAKRQKVIDSDPVVIAAKKLQDQKMRQCKNAVRDLAMELANIKTPTLKRAIFVKEQMAYIKGLQKEIEVLEKNCPGMDDRDSLLHVDCFKRGKKNGRVLCKAHKERAELRKEINLASALLRSVGATQMEEWIYSRDVQWVQDTFHIDIRPLVFLTDEEKAKMPIPTAVVHPDSPEGKASAVPISLSPPLSAAPLDPVKALRRQCKAWMEAARDSHRVSRRASTQLAANYMTACRDYCKAFVQRRVPIIEGLVHIKPGQALVWEGKALTARQIDAYRVGNEVMKNFLHWLAVGQEMPKTNFMGGASELKDRMPEWDPSFEDGVTFCDDLTRQLYGVLGAIRLYRSWQFQPIAHNETAGFRSFVQYLFIRKSPEFLKPRAVHTPWISRPRGRKDKRAMGLITLVDYILLFVGPPTWLNDNDEKKDTKDLYFWSPEEKYHLKSMYLPVFDKDISKMDQAGKTRAVLQYSHATKSEWKKNALAFWGKYQHNLHGPEHAKVVRQKIMKKTTEKIFDHPEWAGEGNWDRLTEGRLLESFLSASIKTLHLDRLALLRLYAIRTAQAYYLDRREVADSLFPTAAEEVEFIDDAAVQATNATDAELRMMGKIFKNADLFRRTFTPTYIQNRFSSCPEYHFICRMINYTNPLSVPVFVSHNPISASVTNVCGCQDTPFLRDFPALCPECGELNLIHVGVPIRHVAYAHYRLDSITPGLEENQEALTKCEEDLDALKDSLNKSFRRSAPTIDDPEVDDDEAEEEADEDWVPSDDE